MAIDEDDTRAAFDRDPLPTRAELLAREAAWFGRDAAQAARGPHDITDAEVPMYMKRHQLFTRWSAYAEKVQCTDAETMEHWPTVMGVFADRMTGRS